MYIVPILGRFQIFGRDCGYLRQIHEFASRAAKTRWALTYLPAQKRRALRLEAKKNGFFPGRVEDCVAIELPSGP